MDVSALPPKPDVHTGEPRPPHGPLEPNTTLWEGEQDKNRAKIPQPPDGYGPILEWFTAPRTAFILPAAFISLIACVIGVIKFGGFDWVTIWWLWILILLPFPMFWLAGSTMRMSAGADWFKHNDKWVDTYHLTKVKVIRSYAKFSVELDDGDGDPSVFIGLPDIQKQQALWDLVYNGILHSIANGTTKEVNSLAREHLKLPG